MKANKTAAVLAMGSRLGKSGKNTQSPAQSKIQFTTHSQVGLICLDKQLGAEKQPENVSKLDKVSIFDEKYDKVNIKGGVHVQQDRKMKQ